MSVSRSAFQFDACTPRNTPSTTTSSSMTTLVQSWRRKLAIIRRNMFAALPGRARPASLRQRHLELDLGELVRRVTELAQEWQPAPIVVEPIQQRLQVDHGQLRVL